MMSYKAHREKRAKLTGMTLINAGAAVKCESYVMRLNVPFEPLRFTWNILFKAVSAAAITRSTTPAPPSGNPSKEALLDAKFPSAVTIMG